MMLKSFQMMSSVLAARLFSAAKSDQFRTIRTLAAPLVRTRKPKLDEETRTVDKASKELKQKYERTFKLLKSTKVTNKLFLVEGKTLLKEALHSDNIKIHKIFYAGSILSPQWIKDVQTLLTAKKPNSARQLIQVTDKLLNSWSDVKTSQGVIAFAEAKDPESIKTTTAALPLTVLLDNVREPGNMGTIIRTAACIGCERILLSKGCVQPWSAKVVRSSMGGIFQLPVYQGLSQADIKGVLMKADTTVLIADFKDSSDSIQTIEYTELDQQAAVYSNVVLIIGNEATGISSQLNQLVAELPNQHRSVLRVKIPLSNRMESLNVGIAFGVLGYEVRRLLLLNSASNASITNHTRSLP